ncbi:hypothetical protein VOLCADRAFT_91189 [Volvox carteri f. nagariensis]|uniref:FCP1 homology domain-containing protein n=1 Tax=Volvox carteri f. nagariensis TaxID=3068 RepID=D8TWE8_VOLCA|nr:uncharacterized protein VOLCADRAFT_91189 [Volvox carteri f. nagariensis]EFJ48032.1 hypothetical protein VOLCADRAFT_91189 [Volvox carteri f. nagariensis]|eukprot:XP_002950717.1 hypothetical protein VOLCADRAFT_91189 [Volvox carteri f. nagariensis]
MSQIREATGRMDALFLLFLQVVVEHQTSGLGVDHPPQTARSFQRLRVRRPLARATDFALPSMSMKCDSCCCSPLFPPSTCILGRFVYALNQFCKDRYGMEYGVSDYWIYEFAKIWGCSQERSNQIVHEFFKSQHFTNGIPVIPGALETLTRLSEAEYELVVVTSRQHVIQDVTLDWLDRHYGGLFQDVYFGNHFALEGKSRKKSEICRTIGARVLIDDNPSYALECAAAGITVLLYDWEGEYPWSKLPSAGVHNSDLIRVVRNWREVEAELASLAPRLKINNNINNNNNNNNNSNNSINAASAAENAA